MLDESWFISGGAPPVETKSERGRLNSRIVLSKSACLEEGNSLLEPNLSVDGVASAACLTGEDAGVVVGVAAAIGLGIAGAAGVLSAGVCGDSWAIAGADCSDC